MSGVEILAVEEVVTKTAFNWNAFLILFGIVSAIFIGFGIFMSIHHDDWCQLLIGILLGLLIGGIFGTILGAGLAVPSEYETQYKVTISDEVSMNDFINRYEIVEQNGRLYTVRERVVE